MRQTLKTEATLQGVGLHLGVMTTVCLKPSFGQGRYFVRVDLPEKPVIWANLSQVREAMLSTELGETGKTVRTVEHLLAALVALGVDDVCIEVDGPEIPLLDGSALIWLEAIAAGGIVTQPGQLDSSLVLTEPLWVHSGDAFIGVLPCPERRFSYGVDYPYAPIGKQWFTWHPDQEDFRTAIAPARTFGFADQIEQLRNAGLIKGGSLDNALVCDHEKWLNPPLRFVDEPVRHKLLDLIGDLSLLGQLPQGHFLAYKASHKLHTQLAQKIEAWAESRPHISTNPSN